MIDIHSKSPYPANALSNFYVHQFCFDGVQCASMDGFLQSLKFKDIKIQNSICAMVGADAKDAGLDQDWKSNQTLYWQGDDYDRHGSEYKKLITRAFDRLFENDSFKDALTASSDEPLDHSIGINQPHETVLTTQEFLDQLYRLRRTL